MSKNDSGEYNFEDKEHISWWDCLKQIEDHYLVFFYSETCTHCQEIKEDVLAFSNDNIVKMYFVNTREQEEKVPLDDDVDHTIGLSDLESFSIVGTPTIIEVTKWIITVNAAGKDNCLSLLNLLRLTY